MKKLITFFVMTMFVTGIAVGETIPSAMMVQVRQSAVREYASVVAPVVSTLSYRDPVLFWGNKDGWAKVQLPGSSCIYYMFMSALAPRDTQPGSVGQAASGVTSPEIVLAGKGFSSTAEDSYARTSHIDYSWVNLMESWDFSSDEIINFLACGL
ncbi:MAG: hypothetical protein LLF89_06775 [Spirochaetaceae bacterium]|nr:hypothetical protein [Spirochaetaceae bacterium]